MWRHWRKIYQHGYRFPIFAQNTFRETQLNKPLLEESYAAAVAAAAAAAADDDDDADADDVVLYDDGNHHPTDMHTHILDVTFRGPRVQ